MLRPEGVRRGGATPLADWSEFMDAFRRRVGVAEPARESRPLWLLLLYWNELLREADLALSTEGDRSRAGLYELLGERAGPGGVVADGEVDSERPWRERRRSPSDALLGPEETLLLAGVAMRFGDGEDDMFEVVEVDEGSPTKS